MIKKYRTEKGLTQKRLGELCGIADSAIRRYEAGNANPKIETLQKIADALDVSIYDLDSNLSLAKIKCLSPQLEKSIFKISDRLFGESYTTRDALVQNLLNEPVKLLEAEDEPILDLFHQLNNTGQDKALEQVELLTKIPEYKRITSEENRDDSEK